MTVKSTVIFEVVNKQVILGRGRGDEVYDGKRAVGAESEVSAVSPRICRWGKQPTTLVGITVKNDPNLLCSLRVHLRPQYAYYREYPSQSSQNSLVDSTQLPVTTLGQF